MDYYIRSYEPKDADDLQRMLSQESVYSNTLQLPCPALERIKEKWQKRLESSNQYPFVAVDKEKERVVGEVTVATPLNPRRAHTAEFGMMVDESYRGLGIGSLLIKHIIDLCFNWLGITRIELNVYQHNQAAIALYEKHGFVLEGHCKDYAFYQGNYIDAYFMAKLKDEHHA